MGEKQPDMVPLSPILRAALSSRQPGEDLDEAILRALKAAHPEHAAMLLGAAAETIAIEMKRTGEDREQTVQRLSAEEPGPMVSVWLETRPADLDSKMVVQGLGDKGFLPLDELPPDIRRAVEEQLGRGGNVRLMLGDLPPNAQRAIKEHLRKGNKVRVVRGAGSARTGCLLASLAALWKLLVR